ncbi:cysteine desulfurase, SufS subfamily [Anaeromyxobacter sp. K]|uniref:cysteine desulfurase n=1 Tax=Anaeromyxobacter sp. (strain K) TaxID=447217 RepID=UPI00015F8A06|nr:cysteine desulfurase [Anaeromyxobacter sp. K]ACG72128.1 cysteine desulfurase, SufS subfamily [Anaeromyxobacter sp. K]
MSTAEAQAAGGRAARPEARDGARGAFDVERVRAEFPILARPVRGQPLAYLDSAATAQKPRAVIDAVRRYYEEDNANVHRGVHLLSERATRLYDGARVKVARFLGASDPHEVVFVRGTTEAVNLVAQTFGRQRVGPGDEILVTELEHHSNIVPWQLLCQEKGATLRAAPVSDAGDLDVEALDRMIGPRTRLVAVAHVSNALGTVNPVAEIVARAHAKGVPVLVDGAQAVPHLAVDLPALGADFYAFSGHKLYGPTGIGVLWGRKALLDALPPWQGGGDMILSVSFEKTTFNAVPHRFEAGTPNIAGAVGLAAAIDWLSTIGLEAAAAHEDALIAHALDALREVPGIRLIGTPRRRAGVISFLPGDVHPHDAGTILDRHGVAVRAGHHCAQPLMRRMGVAATVRASFAAYSTRADVDALVRGLHAVREVFA